MTYQVVLTAEDGEYILDDFTSRRAAYDFIVANKCLYGEGQDLYIKDVFI